MIVYHAILVRARFFEYAGPGDDRTIDLVVPEGAWTEEEWRATGDVDVFGGVRIRVEVGAPTQCARCGAGLATNPYDPDRKYCRAGCGYVFDGSPEAT